MNIIRKATDPLFWHHKRVKIRKLSTTPCYKEEKLSFHEGNTEQLVEWALMKNDNDDESNNDMAPVIIGPSTIGDGNGLFAKRSFKKNELIMTIPYKNVISIENAWEDESLGEDFMFLTDAGGLAGFVAKEACGQMDGIFSELNDDDDDDRYHDVLAASHWQEYLDCLPWTDDHPLWWSDEDTDRLLKGSVINEEVLSTRLQVSNAIENLKGLFWNRYLNKEMSKCEDDVFDIDEDTEAMFVLPFACSCQERLKIKKLIA